METKGFFQFEIIITVLVTFSDSFEYLCYGSTNIINMFTLTVQRSTLVYRRQILTSKVDPRAVRVEYMVTM